MKRDYPVTKVVYLGLKERREVYERDIRRHLKAVHLVAEKP
jgi:hypothetical protein